MHLGGDFPDASCHTLQTGRQPKNIQVDAGADVLSVLLIGSLRYVQSKDVLYELFTQVGLPLTSLSNGSVIFFCVLLLGLITFLHLFLM